MAPREVTRRLFSNDLRTFIVTGYAIGLLILTIWVIWHSSQQPSRSDLQKVVIAVCESVNEGHNRSRVQATIIVKQANVIKQLVSIAAVPQAGETPQQLAASRAYLALTKRKENGIIKQAGVFRRVKDTNCNEAK